MHRSPPGFSVHAIFQARILEWVAVPSCRGSFRPRDQTWVSCVSCIDGWILYHCTTCEGHLYEKYLVIFHILPIILMSNSRSSQSCYSFQHIRMQNLINDQIKSSLSLNDSGKPKTTQNGLVFFLLCCGSFRRVVL